MKWAHACADYVNTCADYYAAAAMYEQLSKLSNAELERRGLNRATLAQNVRNTCDRTDLCSDPGNDLDPSLMHRLEPLSLLLRILVWDGL